MSKNCVCSAEDGITCGNCIKEMELVQDIKQTADTFYKSGGTIEINRGYAYLSINHANGDEYFFQDESFYNLMDEVEQGIGDLAISEEDYLIYTSTNW